MLQIKRSSKAALQAAFQRKLQKQREADEKQAAEERKARAIEDLADAMRGKPRRGGPDQG